MNKAIPHCKCDLHGMFNAVQYHNLHVAVIKEKKTIKDSTTSHDASGSSAAQIQEGKRDTYLKFLNLSSYNTFFSRLNLEGNHLKNSGGVIPHGIL